MSAFQAEYGGSIPLLCFLLKFQKRKIFIRKDILDRKDEILFWISENKPKAEICRQLKCKSITLDNYLIKMGIEQHGNMGRKGCNNDFTYIPAKEQCKKESCKPYILKQKLFREGIKEQKCEICGLSEWMGNVIPLEIHHKDCNHFNNDLDNLQILCPNCHAIQPGNSGANMGNYMGE